MSEDERGRALRAYVQKVREHREHAAKVKKCESYDVCFRARFLMSLI